MPRSKAHRWHEVKLSSTALSAAGLMIALAPLASAATPSGAWTDPAITTSYQNTPMATLSDGRQLKGFAEFDQGIKSVNFALLTDADSESCSAKEVVRPQTTDGGGAKRVDFAFDAPFPCNQRYEVRAIVQPQPRPLRSDTDRVLDLWVAVALPPAPVSSLDATELPDDERGVSVEWDAANVQPDFIGYAVWRSVGDGDWSYLADVAAPATSYTDRALPRAGGALRYKVFGVRPGPDPGSKVLATSSPVARVTIDAYTPPTTVAGDGSGGDGGGTPRPSIRVSGNEAPRVVSRSFARTSPTTADTGFQETLPFQQPQTTDAPPASGNAIATLDDGNRDDNAPRQSLLLVAGGTTTLSWALVLRYLTKRAASF